MSYVSGPGGLWVLSPKGKHLGTIVGPEHAHNLSWGDADGRTLYLTARHSLDFWLTSENLPDPINRVTIDSNGGIVLSYKPNNEEGHQRLIATL